jgi:hypothetical protein
MTSTARKHATDPIVNIPRRIAPDLWIVDGPPLRKMGLSIPVRMTVVRLHTGDLWLHSPVRFHQRLRERLEELGPIRHLIAPNSVHWSFVQDWQGHYGGALTWAAPGLRERRQVKRSGLRLDHDLEGSAPEFWSEDLEHAIVPGGWNFHEVAFLHKPSRTALLTDLIENLEPGNMPPLLRPLAWLTGAMAPQGTTPRHLRFVINRRRHAAAAVATQIVNWQPDRVIFAHGTWFESDAAARLRHGLAWLGIEGRGR